MKKAKFMYEPGTKVKIIKRDCICSPYNGFGSEGTIVNVTVDNLTGLGLDGKEYERGIVVTYGVRLTKFKNQAMENFFVQNEWKACNQCVTKIYATNKIETEENEELDIFEFEMPDLREDA